MEAAQLPAEREPPPGSEGDSQAKRSDTSPETLASDTDRSEARTVGEWQRELREAEALTATERYIGLVLSTWMNYAAEGDRKVDTAYGRGHSLSQTTLAEKSGRDVRTVGRALAGLERKGYLYVHRRPGGTSIYAATVPSGATVHPLPTPDTRAGGPPTPEPRDLRHQSRTAYYSEDTDKAAGPASLTEPTEEEVDNRAFELADAEVRRRIESGRDIRTPSRYAKTMASDYREQARSELVNERRQAAVNECSQCDANGFVEIEPPQPGLAPTLDRCTHRRTA